MVLDTKRIIESEVTVKELKILSQIPLNIERDKLTDEDAIHDPPNLT